jgi:UDP-glucose 4-epimerase
VSKNVVEGYLHYYREAYGMAHTTLALANVYGPRQNPFGEAGVVAMFLGRILKGETPVIYGDGEQTRDFVYVEDVVDAYRLALGAGDGELFNIGTGEQTSVNQLYRHLADICDFAAEPGYAPARAGELERIALDSGKAARLLKWSPATGIRQGLELTARWYEEHLKK